MLSAASLSGLEDLASGGESPRRSAILAALTSQYLDLEPRLSDRHIELYDNVFRMLVQASSCRRAWRSPRSSRR